MARIRDWLQDRFGNRDSGEFRSPFVAPPSSGYRGSPERNRYDIESSYLPERRSHMFTDKWHRARRQRSEAEERLKDRKRADEKYYDAMGYSLEAHPYQFNESSFYDPNYASNRRNWEAAMYNRQNMRENEALDYQREAADLYRQQMSGEDTSISDLSIQKAMAAQRALALSSHNPTLALRNAMRSGRDIAAQAGEMRLKERLFLSLRFELEMIYVPTTI